MTTIRECKSDGRKWTGQSADSIIRRVWGKRAFFQQDSGLPQGFGQIFESLPNTGNGWSATSLTGRVQIKAPQQSKGEG
jgi:hypothetical protein